MQKIQIGLLDASSSVSLQFYNNIRVFKCMIRNIQSGKSVSTSNTVPPRSRIISDIQSVELITEARQFCRRLFIGNSNVVNLLMRKTKILKRYYLKHPVWLICYYCNTNILKKYSWKHPELLFDSFYNLNKFQRRIVTHIQTS